jgi:hypothetical protein
MGKDGASAFVARVVETGNVLRDLLANDARYCRLWQTKAKRMRQTDLSQAAVAEVVADYLWESGERADTEINLARDLKDRVRRALNGVTLTGETLRWFIDAFAFTNEDSKRLWATFTGNSYGVSGIGHTLVRPREMVRLQWHRTLSLFERYRVAIDGSLMDRRTMHTIGAREDGISAYLFVHEPFAKRVRVVHGGKLGRQYQYGDGLRGSDILLDRPLRRGETTSLEYVTEYSGGHARVTEVRRPARQRSENIDLAIEFHCGRLPKAVYWCVWPDHLEGSPVREEPAPVREGVARRFVPFIEQTAVGFRWTW